MSYHGRRLTKGVQTFHIYLETLPKIELRYNFHKIRPARIPVLSQINDKKKMIPLIIQVLIDKACIVMKKVPYDVIKKRKSNEKNCIKFLNIINHFLCFKTVKKYLNNSI